MNSISLFMVIDISEYEINTTNGTYVCSGPNEYPTIEDSSSEVK